LTGLHFLSTWFPQAASSRAEQVDGPFFAVYGAAIVALVLTVGLAIVFIRLLRPREDLPDEVSGQTRVMLRGIWVLGAAGLAALILFAGFSDHVSQTLSPFSATRIDVTTRQGDWDFTYPNGHVADTLHVPTQKPVALTLTSEDVIQSLSIPAFRVNQAILPGRITEAWFAATDTGTFVLRSNIFSGDDYAKMNTAVVAQTDLEFEAWLRDVSDIFKGRTYAEVGEMLYTRQGCVTCHSVDGTKLIGPSFLDVYGHQFKTVDGQTVTADDAYIRESILTPNVSVIEGYQPVMTPYAGILEDREIEALTAWLKTLSSLGGTDDVATDGQEEADE
jgi:cytochrome c oxidase subunit II